MAPTERPTPSGPIAPDLRIVESRVYRGGNIWSYEPAIHLVVDLGVLEDYPSDTIDGFTDRLLELLPGLENHGCSRGVKGGFIERLREGTWLGHVAEHVALQLQQEAGHDLRRGKTRGVKGQPGRYNVIYGYQDEGVGLAAGQLAVRLVNDLVAPAEDFDFEAELESFLRRAERTAFGPSTLAILEEAISRDIPYIRLNSASFVQLGQGVHAQRIRATMTSKTSALAVDIAGDKDLTAKLLGSAGLPVPKQDVVRTEAGAVQVAREIGHPVVVKPLDGNHGRGVGLNLMDDDAVRAAFALAKAESRGGYVVVESFITGRDYRCLIVGGRMQAIAERVPAHVIGDGEHTIEELVAITNSDPRRGVGHEKVLTKIKVDEAAIERVRDQGFELDSVPDRGIMVKLALTGNMSTGGISIDRTFDAHPDNVEIAEEAARLVGLDVAGIDFIAPDIASPVRETGGAICEVNAAPGFRMHTHPTIGEPQFIAKPVVDLLFPPGAPSRVPIVAVTGTNGKTTTSRMIAHIMKGVGRKVGMTSTDGIVIDERLVVKADASGPKSARMVLQNPRVDFAVMEVARGGILREGLGYDRNDVAVVTNVAADHLGQQGIDTVDQLAEVKAIITKVTRPTGWSVLNGDDPRVWAMRSGTRAKPWVFTLDPDSPAIREALGAGGRAITVLDGWVTVLDEHRVHDRLVAVVDLPMALSGLSVHNVANALAGAAAALAIGIPRAFVVEGLRSFAPDDRLNPGRMNTYTVPVTVGTATVIVDLAHNEAGLDALLDVCHGLCAPGAKVRLALGTAGDRTDDILRSLGEIAGRRADEVVLAHKEHYLRGRTIEEMERPLREGLLSVGVAHADSTPTELEGMTRLLANAHDGDVVAVMCHSERAAIAEWIAAHGGRPDDAAAIRRKVVRNRGEHPAQADIDALWEIDDPQARIAAGAALRAAHPGDPVVAYEYAGIFDSAGQEAAAVGLYEEALDGGLREPLRHRCLIQLASTLRNLGRLDEATARIEDAVAAEPTSIGARMFRAMILHDAGRATEGLRGLLEVVAAESSDADVQRYRRSLTAYAAELGDRVSP